MKVWVGRKGRGRRRGSGRRSGQRVVWCFSSCNIALLLLSSEVALRWIVWSRMFKPDVARPTLFSHEQE